MQKYSHLSQTNTNLVRQLGWGLSFVLVIGGGYFIFRQFAIDVMPQLEAYNLFFLAVVAGVASFFSPCAFPLLPSYLAFFAAQDARDGQMQNHPDFRVRAFTLGMIAASGIITFNLI